MMRPPVDPKTPNEIKDYGINWAKQLAADVTISTSTWALPAGITQVGNDSIDGQATVIRLSGGTADENYTVGNTILTSAGETLEAAIEVRVRTAAQIAGI